MQIRMRFDLNMPLGICLDLGGLYLANHEGVAFVEPDPIRAHALNVRRPAAGWQEAFLEIDFRLVLRAIHRLPRRYSASDWPQPHYWQCEEAQVAFPGTMSLKTAVDLRAFIESVGVGYCVRAGAFGDLHFPLLCGMQRLREFRELSQNPGLGYALMESALHHSDEPQEILNLVARLSTMKRRELLSFAKVM